MIDGMVAPQCARCALTEHSTSNRLPRFGIGSISGTRDFLLAIEQYRISLTLVELSDSKFLNKWLTKQTYEKELSHTSLCR